MQYVLRADGTSVLLYIDRKDEQVNKQLFDTLFVQKSDIESRFGGDLRWDRHDDKQASVIAYDMQSGGWRTDPVNWPKVHDEMIDAMIRFHAALEPHISKLRMGLKSDGR